MKKILGILLFFYFCFGIFLLPNGDFSVLKDIPEMYKNCKQTEDKDMTFVDFITDHLINIDGCFDKHDKGDQQKPHKYTFHNHSNFQLFCKIENIESQNKNIPIVFDKTFKFHQFSNFDCYIFSILKPPIFA